MQRLAIIISLVMGLLSNNALAVVCSGGMASDSSTSSVDETSTPDCCRNGICPYHRAHPPVPPPNDSDCTCHLSSGAILMVSAAQTPVIYSDMSSGVVGLPIVDSVADHIPSHTVSPPLAVLTPPPRS